MHIKSIIMASLLALASAAYAAHIELVPELSYNSSGASSPILVPRFDFAEYDNQVDKDQITSISTKGDTSAITRLGGVSSGAPTASSSASYKITPTEVSGSWMGQLFYPINNSVGNTFSFGFVPTRDLRYELEVSYKNFSAEYFQSITLEGGFGTSLRSGSRVAVNQSAEIFFITPSNPSLADPYTFKSSGILESGETWRFVQTSGVGRISGNDVLVNVLGSWNLKFRPANNVPTPVPDAGSTLGLLAFAIGGLGFFRRN